MGFMSVDEALSHVGGKVLVFGKQGTGKSTFVGTFPNINLVDTEDGQTYYIGKNKNIKAIMRTVSASEVQETLDELNDEEMLKTFDTIVIDSGTKLYENMQAAAYEVAEGRARKQRAKGQDVDLEDINISVRDWGHIKRWNQQLATSYILFSELGKWCVVTAHQKDEMRDATKAEKKNLGVDKIKIGEVPDLAKKAEHDFDIVLQFYTEEIDGETKYFAKVLKDRTQVTKRGDIIESPTFDKIWQNNWESTKKYGVKSAVNLNDSVKKDIEAMRVEDDTADNIVAEWKPLMKSITANKDTDGIKTINKFIKDNDINIKNMAASSPDVLQELLDLTKSIANK